MDRVEPLSGLTELDGQYSRNSNPDTDIEPTETSTAENQEYIKTNTLLPVSPNVGSVAPRVPGPLAVPDPTSPSSSSSSDGMLPPHLEALGRLAGGVAHHFNNLLMVIRGNAEILALNPPSPAKKLECAQEVIRAADRACDLVDQLLAFGRRQKMATAAIDLNRVVTETAETLRRLLPSRIRLDLALAPELPPIHGDPEGIATILLRLAANARDAMPAGGLLRVETTSTESDGASAAAPRVVLLVCDTGCGMDEATRKRAFEPYFTTKPLGSGTGLGLSAVYGTVRQLGGTIQLESKPGEGTCVRMEFPPATVGRREPMIRCEQKLLSGRPQTVLVAGMEEDLRQVARRMLEELGCRVLEARTAEEAFALCETWSRHIDLLLAEWIASEGTGFDLCRRLRFLKPELPAVFLYDDASDGAADRFVAPANARVLPTPFTLDGLAAEVRAALGV